MARAANLLSAQNKLDEALVLYERALKGRETSLGVDDPDTLRTKASLSTLLFMNHWNRYRMRYFICVLLITFLCLIYYFQSRDVTHPSGAEDEL